MTEASQSELSNYESGLYYMYRPSVFENKGGFIDQEFTNPNFPGIRIDFTLDKEGDLMKRGQLIKPSELLARIRGNYLKEIKTFRSSIKEAIVEREIDNLELLRARSQSQKELPEDAAKFKLQDRIDTSINLFIDLYKAGALSESQIKYLRKWFQPLGVAFQPKVLPEKVAIIEPVNLPEEERIATMVIPPSAVSIPEPAMVVVAPVREKNVEVKPKPKPKVPVSKVEEFESWQKIPTTVELSAIQGQELGQMLAKINTERKKLQEEISYQLAWRLKLVDPTSLLEGAWHNRRLRNAVLAGLVLANSTFSFKENEPTIFSALANGVKSLPEAGQQLSLESQRVFERMQKDLDYLQKNLPQVTATLEKIKAAVTPVPENKPVQVIPIKEKLPEPPAIPAPPPVAIKSETELNMEFRSAESPVPPPGYVHPETPPESGYAKYIRPGWHSQTGSPYIKGLDYGALPWAGVGDIQNPEDIDGIPVDANAKNFRMTMTGEGDIPRVAAVVEKAHRRGMQVAVNFSTPELAADKVKFKETIRRILLEAHPDYLQYENEMGWLDEKGKPNQYYVGSHESIWKDYPAYVKIVQDEIRERERELPAIKQS